MPFGLPAEAVWFRGVATGVLAPGLVCEEDSCACVSSELFWLEECASDCDCEPAPLVACTASCVPCVRMSRKEPLEDFAVVASGVGESAETDLSAILTCR